MINITQGNDCTLLAAFTRGGESYTFDSVRKVRLLSAYGRAYALTFSGGEAGLLLALPHTMPAGRYGVEVTGTEGAAERRTMFRDMVEITAATARASRDCRAEAGCDDYDIAVSLSLVEGASGAEATQASVARFLTARLDGTLEDGTLYSVCQPQGGASGLETGRQVSLFNGGRWLSGLDMAGLRELPVVWEDAFMRAAAEEAKKIWPTVEIAADDGSSDGEDADDGSEGEDEEYELLATLKARAPYTYGDLMDMDNKGLVVMQYYYGYPYVAAATEDSNAGFFAEIPMTFAVAAVPEVDGLCRGVTEVGDPGFNYWVRLAGVPMAARLKAVGERGFSSTAIREAVLPVCASVGNSAFSSCDALSSVSLPACGSVGNSAFAYCDALSSVSLPVCASVGESAFSSCDALSSVSLPACESVGERAFQECSSLEVLELPEAVTIGDYAFSRCQKLATLKLPKATTVGGTLGGLQALETVELPLLAAIGTSFFDSDQKLSSAGLPAVTEVGDYAFNNCPALETVELPACATVGSRAFSGCSSLSQVSLPAATAVGDYAFNGCAALKTLELPSVETPTRDMLGGDYGQKPALETVSLPKAKTVPESMFSGMETLGSVSLPVATGIGNYAFQSCTSLETVELPEAVTVGDDAFNNCQKLASVGLPKVTEVSNYVFCGCTSLSSISLPVAKEIGYFAFYECSSLADVSLPVAETIGESAFQGCTALVSISLPEVTEIGSWAFINSSLKSAELPKLATAGNNALDVPSLAELVLGATPPSSTGGLPTGCVVYVPDDAVETYKASDVWKGYTIKPLSERAA